MTREELIEKMARDIRAARNPYITPPAEGLIYDMALAQAALSAIEAAECVVVPVSWEEHYEKTLALFAAAQSRAEAAEARVKVLEKALAEIRDHPERYDDGKTAYAVGWAFFNVQRIAYNALEAK